MDMARKIGVGIVMIVPAVVGAGALWSGSGGAWSAVILWIGLMAALYGSMIMGKGSFTGKS
jgi:hypothetical protein